MSEAPNCSICGSKLIRVEQTVSQNGQASPMTVTKYQCSDQNCQDGINKKIQEEADKRAAFEKSKALRLSAKSFKV